MTLPEAQNEASGGSDRAQNEASGGSDPEAQNGSHFEASKKADILSKRP